MDIELDIEDTVDEVEVEVSEIGERGYSAYEVAVQNGYEGTEEQWLASLKGDKGDKGDTGDKGDKGDKGDTGATGATGNGISSIEKTSTSGLVDTYTITFTNGTTTTFNVTNGKGISSISKTSTSGLTDTYTITYNDNTTSTFEVVNGRGITSIDLTSTQDNIDTYTITYNDGTTSTYTVTNSTVTDQEFEELQEKTEYLDKYANALIKQNSSGTDLTINDTAECPMPIVLSPSELIQATTTGKNICSTNNINFDSTYYNYLSIQPAFTPGETYTLSFVFDSIVSDYGGYVRAQINGASENIISLSNAVVGNKYSITFSPNSADNTLQINIQKTPYDNGARASISQIQVEKNSSATTYEPYTGAKASPNPDYPQDIHVITGSNKIPPIGKNLLKPAFQTDTKSQITCTYTKNGWLLNGTYSGSSNYTFFKIFDGVLKAGTYSINGITGASGTTYQLVIRKENSAWIYLQNIDKTFTLTEPTQIDMRLYAYSGYGTFNNLLLPYQLELNTTKTAYKPYEEINCLIDLGAINIFDKNTATYKNNYIKDDNGNEIASAAGGGYLTSYVDVNPNTKYTINGEITDSGTYWRVYFYDSSKNWISRTDPLNLKAIPYTFTTPNNCYYIQFQYKRSAYDADTIQIEKGEIAGAYAPYGQPSLEYCKIGNYSDIFFKNTTDSEYYDSTLELNKWYLKKRFTKKIFDGTESFTKSTSATSSGATTFYTSITNYLDISEKTSICNYFKATINQVATNLNDGEFCLRPETLSKRIYLCSNNFSTAQELINWITNLYNNSTPLIMYYLLATPTNILLNETLQTELEQIYNWLLSYQDQTNISQTNYDLPFIINATTCYDLNKLLNRVEVLESEV